MTKPLVGGIGLTELSVYNQRHAPDGNFSGCPHIHGICDEAYFVLEGSGAVEFHDSTNGMQTLQLTTGQYVEFSAGVLHRIISDGDLKILGIMSNAGLPEAGDARIYFGKDVDEDEEQFKHLTELPKKQGLSGALERRDTSVQAYLKLLKLMKEDRKAYLIELDRFHNKHLEFVRQHKETFEAAIQQGPLASALRAQSRLAARLERTEPLDIFNHHRTTQEQFGMCGLLHPIQRSGGCEKHE